MSAELPASGELQSFGKYTYTTIKQWRFKRELSTSTELSNRIAHEQLLTKVESNSERYARMLRMIRTPVWSRTLDTRWKEDRESDAVSGLRSAITEVVYWTGVSETVYIYFKSHTSSS